MTCLRPRTALVVHIYLGVGEPDDLVQNISRFCRDGKILIRVPCTREVAGERVRKFRRLALIIIDSRSKQARSRVRERRDKVARQAKANMLGMCQTEEVL